MHPTPTTTRGEAVPLPELRTFYKLGLRSKGLAARTIQLYLGTFDRFVAFLDANGLPADADKITRRHVEAWIAAEFERGRSPATVNQDFRSLQAFWKWAVADEVVESSPMTSLASPRVPHKEAPVLERATIDKLLDACRGRDLADRRDLAMISLLADNGIRRGELVGLRVDDIDFERTVAIVDAGGSKSRRARAVPFGARTATALARYIRARREHRYADRPELWLGPVGPITRDGVNQILERRCAMAGLPRIGPHAFRHTFAHEFLADGGNEGDLMQITGWKSRSMVDRYASSTAAARARAAYRSPVDRL